MPKENPSLCVGKIQSNPDIAGVGVVSAVWTISAIAIAISWVVWHWTYIRPAEQESKQYRIAMKCLATLGDIQLVTALAIITSSIILMKRSDDFSLYHVFIARCLAQASLAGHGAALVFDIKKQCNWKARLCLIGITIALYCAWTFMCIEEFHHFSLEHPKKCFENSSFLGGTYHIWMQLDLIMMPLSYIWFLMEPVKGVSRTAEAFNTWVPGLLSMNNPKEAVSSLRKQHQINLILTNLVVVLGQLSLLILKLLLYVLISLTLGPPSILPPAQTFFAVWSIFDLVTVWTANTHRIIACPTDGRNVSLMGNSNPEYDWGFGQLLPWFLLILPLLQLADIYKEEIEND